MKIVVLCGGISPERDVSLSTGTQVASALRKAGHWVALIDSASDYGDNVEELFTYQDSGAKAAIKEIAPELSSLLSRDSYFGSNVLNACRKADIVFNAMHGAAGEDGTLQAAFDLMGIKYTGSGAKGCSAAMDKSISKSIIANIGSVNMPRGISIERAQFTDDREGAVSRAIERVGLPLVVKPACGGSSVGVSIVRSENELLPALELALGYEPKIIVEEYIKGREFSTGVLGTKALPAIEIRPKTGFYDYKNKYQQGMTDEICPADIPPEAEAEMRSSAAAVHAALGLSAYSRTDFIMTDDGKIYALEANTLPGMTPMSLLPQEAAAVGIDFPALCQTIINESMKKYD